MSIKNLIENEDYQIVTPAENGLFTVNVFNPNSPSNSGLLEDFQNVDNIPQIYIDEDEYVNDEELFNNSDLLDNPDNVTNIPSIPTNVTSCFDLSNLPKIETLDSLLKNLCEVMVRFDGCVRDYQKADFEQLIKTVSNSLIYLYTNNSPTNTGNHVVGFRGVAKLDTNPYLEAIELNNKYPGIYFAQDIGTYPYFSVDVTSSDNFDAIVLLVPYINSDGEVIRYDKSIYNLNTPNSNFTYSSDIPRSVWVIQHNLNKKPAVVITNRDGYLCEGQVFYTDNNNLTITFSAPLEGYADLN